MGHPLEDIAAAAEVLKDPSGHRGRLDSNNEDLLTLVQALLGAREALAAWLEAEYERLMLTWARTNLPAEHAVVVARALLNPTPDGPGPGRPGPVIDNARTTLNAILGSAGEPT
jgi:hypothetical protein